MTGVGAAVNTAQVKPGSTVAVVGVGGVGVNVVQGARIAGAEKIIVLDRYDSKLESAFKFGATHSIKMDDNPREKLLTITPDGVDYSFEATGNARNMELCLQPDQTWRYDRHRGGRKSNCIYFHTRTRSRRFSKDD